MLRNSVSVWRKSHTRRTLRRNCHFENVAKKSIKPDLGDIGQQVNGAGIGDLANTRVREWKVVFFLDQHVYWFKNEKRPLKAFVWKVLSGSQGVLLLFGVLYSTCVLFQSLRKDCAALRTQNQFSFQDLVRRLPHSTFLDLTTQTDVPDDAWEDEITSWNQRSTRDPSSGSSFWPQSDATSRLGPDLMPPSRSMRTDDEMSVQEPGTTHVSVAHPSTSETISSDVPGGDNSSASYSVQTSSKSVGPCGTSETYQRWRRWSFWIFGLSSWFTEGVRKFEKWEWCLQTGMPDMLDSAWLAIKTPAETSTSCWSQSVFRWTKRRYTKSAAIPIQKKPSMWWSNGDVQRKCQLCQLNRNVSLSKRKTRNSARLSNILWSTRHHVKESHRLRWWKCVGLWRSKMMVLWKHGWSCRVLQTKDLARFRRLLQPRPVDLVRFFWHLPHHLVFKLTKETRNVHFFRETWTSNVWTMMTMMTISKLSQQPVSDTFCEPVPGLSRKLRLEHHQCIRLLKAVYGLVNAPRRWYHRVATDLRNLTSEQSVMEPCLWTFRDENGVIPALCLVFVDDFMLACSDSPFGKHLFESINILYEWRKWESRVLKQCAAQIIQAYNKYTRTWGGFEITFTEYVEEISIITLPSHRRRDKKSKNHTTWAFSTSSLEWSVSFVGNAMFATIAGTSVAVDGTNTSTYSGHDLWDEQTGSEGDCVGTDTTQNPRSSFSFCGYVHRCCGPLAPMAPRKVDSGLHWKFRAAASQRIKHVSDILAFESIESDGEAVYIRLCLKEVLFGQLDVWNWQSEARQIPAALVVDCRGVCDALARSSSSCLGLKNKKSGLETLAFKQSLVECGTVIRWCHSAAQLGDVVTKDSDVARAPWEMFVRRGFRWKLIHDPKFESSRNRAKRGIDTLDEPEDNHFADDVPRDPKSATLITWNACWTNFSQLFFLPACSGHWFPASEATDSEYCDDF